MFFSYIKRKNKFYVEYGNRKEVRILLVSEAVRNIEESNALIRLLIEKGIITRKELDNKIDEVRMEKLSEEDKEEYINAKKSK